MSLPGNEMRDAYECGEFSLVRRDAPFAFLASDIVRAITYDSWLETPDLSGGFWFGNPGDGTFLACTVITFPIGSISEVDCSGRYPWICSCPTREPDIEGPHVMVRDGSLDFASGNVGYDGFVHSFAFGPHAAINSTSHLVLGPSSGTTFVEHVGTSCDIWQLDPLIEVGIVAGVAPRDGLYLLHFGNHTSRPRMMRLGETPYDAVASRICTNVSVAVVLRKGDVVGISGYYEMGSRFIRLGVGNRTEAIARLLRVD